MIEFNSMAVIYQRYSGYDNDEVELWVGGKMIVTIAGMIHEIELRDGQWEVVLFTSGTMDTRVRAEAIRRGEWY